MLRVSRWSNKLDLLGLVLPGDEIYIASQRFGIASRGLSAITCMLQYATAGYTVRFASRSNRHLKRHSFSSIHPVESDRLLSLRFLSHRFTGPPFLAGAVAVSYDGGAIGAAYCDGTWRTGPLYDGDRISLMPPVPKERVPPSPGRTYFCSSAQALRDSSRSSADISLTRLAGPDAMLSG